MSASLFFALALGCSSGTQAPTASEQAASEEFKQLQNEAIEKVEKKFGKNSNQAKVLKELQTEGP